MSRRRRTSSIVLITGALGAGLIAFPSGAAAAPPVVPSCTPKATSPQGTFSKSCVTLMVNALAPPIGTPFENIRLGVRARSTFSSPSNEVQTLTLRFDDDLAVNLAGIPTCPATEVQTMNIAQAYEQCGPGADGSPASEGNALLSPAGNVSGIASTVHPAFPVVCVMIFKGANNNSLTIYSRAVFGGTSATSCNDPNANETAGSNVVLTGTLTHQPAASPYDWTITVPGYSTAGASVDDFYVTLQRGAAFRARCPAGTSPHKLQGVFDYTGTEPTDTISPPYPGTQDQCP
jgi:hypothetical protein